MPKTPKQISAHDYHQHCWRHNSFMGMAKMMERNATTIALAASASFDAQRIATDIANLAKELDTALRAERIDPK